MDSSPDPTPEQTPYTCPRCHSEDVRAVALILQMGRNSADLQGGARGLGLSGRLGGGDVEPRLAGALAGMTLRLEEHGGLAESVLEDLRGHVRKIVGGEPDPNAGVGAGALCILSFLIGGGFLLAAVFGEQGAREATWLFLAGLAGWIAALWWRGVWARESQQERDLSRRWEEVFVRELKASWKCLRCGLTYRWLDDEDEESAGEVAPPQDGGGDGPGQDEESEGEVIDLLPGPPAPSSLPPCT